MGNSSFSCRLTELSVLFGNSEKSPPDGSAAGAGGFSNEEFRKEFGSLAVSSLVLEERISAVTECTVVVRTEKRAGRKFLSEAVSGHIPVHIRLTESIILKEGGETGDVTRRIHLLIRSASYRGVSSDQTENRTGDRRVSYIYEIKAASPEFLLRNSFRRTGFVRNGTVSVADVFSETLMRPNDSADSMSLHSPLSYTLHQDRSVSGGKLGFRMPFDQTGESSYQFLCFLSAVCGINYTVLHNCKSDYDSPEYWVSRGFVLTGGRANFTSDSLYHAEESGNGSLLGTSPSAPLPCSASGDPGRTGVYDVSCDYGDESGSAPAFSEKLSSFRTLLSVSSSNLLSSEDLKKASEAIEENRKAVVGRSTDVCRFKTQSIAVTAGSVCTIDDFFGAADEGPQSTRLLVSGTKLQARRDFSATPAGGSPFFTIEIEACSSEIGDSDGIAGSFADSSMIPYAGAVPEAKARTFQAASLSEGAGTGFSVEPATVCDSSGKTESAPEIYAVALGDGVQGGLRSFYALPDSCVSQPEAERRESVIRVRLTSAQSGSSDAASAVFPQVGARILVAKSAGINYLLAFLPESMSAAANSPEEMNRLLGRRVLFSEKGEYIGVKTGGSPAAGGETAAPGVSIYAANGISSETGSLKSLSEADDKQKYFTGQNLTAEIVSLILSGQLEYVIKEKSFGALHEDFWDRFSGEGDHRNDGLPKAVHFTKAGDAASRTEKALKYSEHCRDYRKEYSEFEKALRKGENLETVRSNFRKEIGELYRFAGEINKEFFYDDFTADGRLTRPVVGTLHIEQTAGGGINICTEGARICLNPDSVSIFSNKSIAIRSEESIDLRAKGVISMAVGDSAMNMTSKEINLAAVARAPLPAAWKPMADKLSLITDTSAELSLNGWTGAALSGPTAAVSGSLNAIIEDSCGGTFSAYRGSVMLQGNEINQDISSVGISVAKGIKKIPDYLRKAGRVAVLAGKAGLTLAFSLVVPFILLGSLFVSPKQGWEFVKKTFKDIWNKPKSKPDPPASLYEKVLKFENYIDLIFDIADGVVMGIDMAIGKAASYYRGALDEELEEKLKNHKYCKEGAGSSEPDSIIMRLAKICAEWHEKYGDRWISYVRLALLRIHMLIEQVCNFIIMCYFFKNDGDTSLLIRQDEIVATTRNHEVRAEEITDAVTMSKNALEQSVKALKNSGKALDKGNMALSKSRQAMRQSSGAAENLDLSSLFGE